MMQLSLSLAGKNYQVAMPPRDISIPMHFNGPQPNTYGVQRASAQAVEAGEFVGDTRRGGSCNFEEYRLVPHCNGTHTECIGHIALERISIVDELKEALIPALLLSLPLRDALSCGETYTVPFNEGDKVITAADLQVEINKYSPAFTQALALRSLPNGEGKVSRDYMQEAPGFFTLEAMEYISSLGVQHLLTDLPSVDRLFDEGKLGVHRIFWQVDAGVQNIPSGHSARTITEMIYAPDDVQDGIYLLNLQIAPFVSDAAPSRPMIYPLHLL